MTNGSVGDVLHILRREVLRRDGGALTDGALLERYVQERDDAAFAALVHRHGPMVLGVCRRLLPIRQDAEDAFQATFLVLVRRAALVEPRGAVANWLYGVAHRTALKARTLAKKRQARERAVAQLPEPEAPADDRQRWLDVRSILDAELSRLPDKYRAPIILCDLESKSRKEAARQLGWRDGTLSGRLARGRKMLARRLSRRGLVLSASCVALLLSREAAPACVCKPLARSTLLATGVFAAGRAGAPGVVPAAVVTLTKGVLRSMMLAKFKIVGAMLLLAGLACLGFGVLPGALSAGGQANPGEQPRPAEAKPATDAARAPTRSLKIEATAQGVVVQTPELQGSAPRVWYDEAKGLLVLEGSSTSPAVLVRTRNGQSERVRAEKIIFSLKEGTYRAESKDIESRVEVIGTGSLLIGAGVNSDAGLAGSVNLNERNFDLPANPARPGRTDRRADLMPPITVWRGRYAAPDAQKDDRWTVQLLGTADELHKFWQQRRKNEEEPGIDFKKSVVVLVTWKGMAADSVHLGPCGKHQHGVWVGAYEGSIDGVGYVAGLFSREGIEEIEGIPLPK
jgi:RNA polymerase sigma factor (sigma-70 family)